MDDLRDKETALRFMERLWLPRVRDSYLREGTIWPRVAIIATLDLASGGELEHPAVVDVYSDAVFDDDPEATKSGPLDREPGVRSKERFVEFVRGMCMKTRAIGVGFAMEAWTVNATDEERRRLGPPANHPNRREILFASLDHLRLPKGILWEATISRVAITQGYASAFERHEVDDVVHQGGRFSEFFPRELWQ